MKRLLFSIVFLIIIFQNSFSQNLCSFATVLFESGKFELTPQATKTLDSLISFWGSGEFYLELEGHTDSVKNKVYNDTLSLNRIKSVKNYIQKNSHASLNIRDYPNGENKPVDDNGTETGKAHNRRVILRFLPTLNKNLTVKGKNGVSATIAVDQIKECRICDINLSIKTYFSDEEIDATGIGLTNTEGRELTTCGMLELVTDCPSIMNDTNVTVTFEIPMTFVEDPIRGWVFVEGKGWELADSFSINNNVITITQRNPGSPARINCDCIKKREMLIADSSGWNIVKGTLSGYPQGLNISPDFDESSFYYFNNWSGNFSFKFFPFNFSYFAVDSAGNYYYAGGVSDSIEHRIWDARCLKTYHYVTYRENYTPITFSDTLLLIKPGKKFNISEVHWKLKGPDFIIPFQKIKRRKWKSYVIEFPSYLFFTREDGGHYQTRIESIKKKYRKKKNMYVAKIKKL